MPRILSIRVDGETRSIDRMMSEAEARDWLFDQATRLTRRVPIIAVPKDCVEKSEVAPKKSAPQMLVCGAPVEGR